MREEDVQPLRPMYKAEAQKTSNHEQSPAYHISLSRIQ